MNCVLIGNGTSALDRENGNLIDSFDKVVRFNLFYTEGLEKFVGTKTNIWFNVRHFDKMDEEWRTKLNYDMIYIHTWVWNKKKDKIYKSFVDFYKKTNIKIEKTEKIVCDELGSFIPETTYREFSTGLIGIWIMLKKYDSVYITGFDWWEREKHHYNDNLPRGDRHKPQHEKIIIDILKNQNKVKLL